MADCIYLRKSRIDLEAEVHGYGDTLKRHEQTLLRHANNLGRSITHIYREVVSGETIATRPQMQQLLRDVEAGSWDAVHVMEVERLARGDTLDQGIVAQAFLYSKTLIVTPKKTYDPNNEFDEEYFEFGLFMSRREYKTINRRQQAGRLASIREGKWVANKAPYGYQRIKLEGQKGWTLAPQEPAASIVRDIFRWITEGYADADGIKQRLGVSQVVRQLNELGVPSPSGIDWTPWTVRNMLHNEAYAGWVRWGRRAIHKNLQHGEVHKSRPIANQGDYPLFCGLHPAIIEQDIFDKAQTILEKQPSLPGPKTTGIRNPLAGLIICGGCGRAMVRRPNQSGRQETLICPYTSCKTVGSDLRLVEASIIAALSDWVDGFSLSVPSVNGERDSELETFEKALLHLKKERFSLTEQEKRTFELLEQRIYTVDQFQMRSKELSTRIQKLEIKIQRLSDQILMREKEPTPAPISLPQIRSISDAYFLLENAEEKNRLLRSMVEKVVYNKTTGGRYQKSDLSLSLFPRFPG